MVKTLLTAAATLGTATNAATTATVILGGALSFFDNAADDNAQAVMRTTGAVSKLYMRLSSNAVTGTTTFRFRKNSVDGNGVISIASTTSGEFVDSANIADTVVPGDKICGKFTYGDGTHTLTFTVVSMLFEADNGNAVTKFMYFSNQAQTTSSTFYQHISGFTEYPNVTESLVKLDMQVGGTFRNAGLFVGGNGVTNASTYTFRKNGAGTAMTISITGSTTGTFEDNTNTVAVVATDDVCHQMVTGTLGGAGTLTVFNSWVEFEDTSSTPMQGLSIHYLAADQLFPESADTVYNGLNGVKEFTGNHTESRSQMAPRYDTTFKNLTCLVNTNSVAASTVTFRKDSLDGNITLSIPTNSTGYFTNSTDTDDTISTTETSYKIVIGAGTSLLFGYIHILSKPRDMHNYITFL